jgi:electron transport complex protein RnfC
LIEECGGFNGEVGKILNSGPMLGTAQYRDVPVIKGTCCILVLDKKKARIPDESTCIRCGMCVDVCPTGLLPTVLGKLAHEKRFDVCMDYHILDCMECGSCAYVCPSKIPIVQLIRYGKEEIKRRQRE